MPNTLVLKVGERPAKAVGRFLKSKGFILSDIVGNKLGRIYPEMCGIGILEDHPYWPPDMRYRQTAILDFYGYVEELKFGGWVFLLSGLKNFRKLKNLAQELCRHFQVGIAVKLLCTPKELSELKPDELIELKKELARVLEPS